MIDVAAFMDEIDKIAAHKSRKGSTPIRVHNLASKDVVDKRSKTTTKLAMNPIQVLQTPAGKVMALMAGGYLAGKGIERGIDDWRLGRMIRRQQQGQM
jgi:hypothetical protein